MLAGIATAIFAVGFTLVVIVGQLSFIGLVVLGIIVIPVGALIWFWLLAYEFAERDPQKAEKVGNSILDKLPFRIQKRVRPKWAVWVKRREIEGQTLKEQNPDER